MECRSALLSSSFLNSPGEKGTVILMFKCFPKLQGPQVSLAQGLLTETVMRNSVLISHAETGRHVSAQQACGQNQDTGLQSQKCPLSLLDPVELALLPKCVQRVFGGRG